MEYSRAFFLVLFVIFSLYFNDFTNILSLFHLSEARLCKGGFLEGISSEGGFV